MRSILMRLSTAIGCLLAIAQAPQAFAAETRVPLILSDLLEERRVVDEEDLFSSALSLQTPAVQIDPNAVYRLTSNYLASLGRNQSLAVSESGGNYTLVMANTQDSAADQLWKFIPLGGGKYRLINLAAGEGKSLATQQSGNRYVLSIQNADRSAAQIWTLTAVGDGKVQLNNDALAGRSLYISALDPSFSGFLLQMTATSTGQPKQVWALTKGTAPAATPASDSGDKLLCWKQSFGRGVGGIGGDCPTDYEKDGGLCYPKCRDGFVGVGPVCWQKCPSRYRDDGAFCAKAEAYGRGAGYPWKFGDTAFDLSAARGRCEGENGGSGTCEQDGAIYYPKCKEGFVKVGCCVCSPACPPGSTDIGVSCAKSTYTRGVGKVPSCGAGLQADAGLCYEPCPRDYTGVGPVCWGNCPADFPFNCGAGCAKNEAACATAVTDMTLNTVGVAITILSYAAGGPGVINAFKVGAKAAATEITKAAARGAFKFTLSSMASPAGRRVAWVFAKQLGLTYLKTKFKDPKNLRWVIAGGIKTLGLKATNEAAKQFAGLKEENVFDWEILTALDPTGVSSMVLAFTKYGNCTLEPLTASADEIDFGTVSTPVSAVKKVELTVQQPTTITEITTSPFTNASITANADCVGQLLQRGQKCTVNIQVSGQSGIDGAVQIYTTDYDVVPLVIPIKANSSATPATPVEGVDDAVNITSVVGVWAWQNNQGTKVVVRSDGTAELLGGPKGTVTVKDPIRRVYEFKVIPGLTDTVTLSEDRQTLTGNRQALNVAAGPVSAIRRPWDPRCKPGEEYHVGLCYDVPPDYRMTVPGFMGKPCAEGWRDDLTWCWPQWTGEDLNEAKKGEHPIMVTDCARFSGTNPPQKCPTNFFNTGGPANCSCVARPTARDVKSIIGTVPVK